MPHAVMRLEASWVAPQGTPDAGPPLHSRPRRPWHAAGVCGAPGQLRARAEASRRWWAAAVNMAVPQQVYEMLIDEYKCLSMCAARALATSRRAAAVV